MKLTNRAVLIVGGTSGIGLELAHRFAQNGNTVVVGGRKPEPQDGLQSVQIDVTDPASVLRARNEVLAAHPGLDVVVTMSGVLLTENLRDPAHITDAETMVATNLLGTIRVTDAFTPHLIGRGTGTIITVSSGIAFLPFPLMATYGATKAAVHSYTESLRAHLAGTGVEVAELVPPAVATPAMAKLNPAAVPVDDYLDEVMDLLAVEPTTREIIAEAALPLRWAERDGTYAELLERRSAPLNTLTGR
ncbi:SDR family NAD(P)-dependent oxidoreductase [Streptomyces sp. NPDC007074]|uniref:SDR family oxidoreductase n=1 Tax=Streptomyces sp. NPDC007074 TaxID=3156764 RepID=UPI0033CF4A54